MIVNPGPGLKIGGQSRVRSGENEMESLRRLLRDYDFLIAHTTKDIVPGSERIMREVDEDGVTWLAWSVDVLGD